MYEQTHEYWRIRKPDDNGATPLSDGYEFYIRGEHVEFIENPPNVPDIFSHVWQWFLDLNNSRSGDGCISFSDMQAYFALIDEKPSRLDLEILQNLDRQYLYIRDTKEIEVINSAL